MTTAVPSPKTRTDTILDYWFGAGRHTGAFDEDRLNLWFRGDTAVDNYIRAQFATDLEEARQGRLPVWQTTSEGWLALIIILDQFSRHIYRNTPQAFAQDAQAQALALEGIKQGIDQQLLPIQRVFFYLPLEHAEDHALQARSVAAFQSLLAAVTGEQHGQFEIFLDYAVRHRDVIARFGRFPDLNAILGRSSTSEEIEFLQQPGSSFL